MCTLVVISTPDAPHPVVVASNRDEHLDRPARPFGRHWPGEPFRAGQDVAAGGTWAALHDGGFGVFVLNGPRALGPAEGKRSRGQLVLDLVRSGSLDAAETEIRGLSPAAYRPFHLVAASAERVVGLSLLETSREWHETLPGVAIWSASGVNTSESRRQAVQRPVFEALASSYRESFDVDGLIAGLESALAAPAPPGEPWHAAMRVRSEEHRFGTRSSLIVAFDREGGMRVRVSDGPPEVGSFRDALD